GGRYRRGRQPGAEGADDEHCGYRDRQDEMLSQEIPFKGCAEVAKGNGRPGGVQALTEPNEPPCSLWSRWPAFSTPATGSAISTARSPSTRSSASRRWRGCRSATRRSTSSWACPARTRAWS